jgi:hypothetical protein
VHIDAQIKWEREKAEKRRIWDQEFERQKEEERLSLAREELAREKSTAWTRGCRTVATWRPSSGRGRR